MIAQQPRAAAEVEAEVGIEVARRTEADVSFEHHEADRQLEARLGLERRRLLEDQRQRRGQLATAIFVAWALENYRSNIRLHARAPQLDAIVSRILALDADRPAIELVTHAHAQAGLDRRGIETLGLQIEPARVGWCDRQPRGDRERAA